MKYIVGPLLAAVLFTLACACFGALSGHFLPALKGVGVVAIPVALLIGMVRAYQDRNQGS